MFKTPKLLQLINGHPAWILLDSGASRNFISETFMKKKKMTTTKAKPFKVEFADGTKSQVLQEVKIQDLHLDKYHASDLPAQVINLQCYNAILGKPWLHYANLLINWCNNTLTFKYECKTIEVKADIQRKLTTGCNSIYIS